MNAASQGVDVESSPLPVKEACPQVRRRLQASSPQAVTAAVAALGALAAMAWGGVGSHAASAARRKGLQRLWFGSRKSLACGPSAVRFRNLRKIVSGRALSLYRSPSWGDLRNKAAGALSLQNGFVLPLYSKHPAMVPSSAAVVATAVATAVQNAVYPQNETTVLPSIRSSAAAFCHCSEVEDTASAKSPWMDCGTAWRRRLANDELSVLRQVNAFLQMFVKLKLTRVLIMRAA